MTEARTDRSSNRARLAPVIAGTVLAFGLLALLVPSAFNAAATLSAPRASAPVSEAPPTTAGAEAPVEVPVTPPDRASDQSDAANLSSTVYIVQPGDTLTAISAMHGVAVDAIAAFNGISDRNVLSQGEHLRIPITYELPHSGE